MYQTKLELLISNSDPSMFVFIDETHKDRNASRRRRAWGKQNSGGIALNRWFKNTIQYTMIIAANIDGFIPATCEIFHRNEASDEGAAGTVDRDNFVEWVRDKLVPSLGNYQKGERRSIVVMNNASTHMFEEVRDLIEDAGAVLLYTDPYSPDLNPIEKMFNIYKMCLKKNEIAFELDWYSTHWYALESVSRDIAIKEFRACDVPCSDRVKTSNEIQQEMETEVVVALLIMLVCCIYNTH